ncbi:hypothetical protein [Nocardiopsis sp. NPDC006938]|uniref:hypothetical protein n=1 Tax=Nocardiopsis sp. NPDC006938 TaxID=3364337 RepID=UPI0036A0D4E6
MPTPVPLPPAIAHTGPALHTESTHELTDLWAAHPTHPLRAYLTTARTHPLLARWWAPAPAPARTQALTLCASAVATAEAHDGRVRADELLAYLGPQDHAARVARELLASARSGHAHPWDIHLLGAAEAMQSYAILWTAHPTYAHTPR